MPSVVAARDMLRVSTMAQSSRSRRWSISAVMFGLSLVIDKFDVRYIYHLFDQWQKAFSLAAEGRLAVTTGTAAIAARRGDERQGITHELRPYFRAGGRTPALRCSAAACRNRLPHARPACRRPLQCHPDHARLYRGAGDDRQRERQSGRLGRT